MLSVEQNKRTYRILHESGAAKLYDETYAPKMDLHGNCVVQLKKYMIDICEVWVGNVQLDLRLAHFRYSEPAITTEAVIFDHEDYLDKIYINPYHMGSTVRVVYTGYVGSDNVEINCKMRSHGIGSILISTKAINMPNYVEMSTRGTFSNYMSYNIFTEGFLKRGYKDEYGDITRRFTEDDSLAGFTCYASQ